MLLKTLRYCVQFVCAIGIANPAQGDEISDQVPFFAVTRMSEPPTIDGTIDPIEWREAMAVGGVADQSTNMSKPLLPRPTTFYLGWDPDHIYFAARTYIRPGAKPAVPSGRSQGLAYVWDAGLELNWQPLGANVPPGNKDNSYKWFLNALGFIGDTSRLALGQQFKSWNPQFTIEAGLSEPGSAPDGGRWWQVEMRATPEDFELSGPHRAGDQWRMMLGINHFPSWMQARIPCRGPYLDPYGYNVMTLVDNTAAVQMTMDDLHNLATDGTTALTVQVFNPTVEIIDVSVAINVADVVDSTQTLTVAPGASAQFRIHEMLPEPVTAGQASVSVTQGEQRLYYYAVPFEVGAYAFMMSPTAPPDTTSFAFETRFNPVRSWLLVKGDTYYLEGAREAQSLQYRVLNADKAEPIAEGHITRIAEYYLQDVVQLPSLDPGTYRVEASMELTDGRVLGPMTGSFVKKDEAAEYAHWWDTEHGDVERIIPPYTPLSLNGSTVGSLGRQYRLNALGLPDEILACDGTVSARPARVVVVKDGTEHIIDLGTPEFIETTDWRLRFTGTAQGAGLKFSATGWVEQDGLVYVDLSYESASAEPVRIDALRLEYPLSAADADGLLCIGPGNNYSSRTTMLLPRDQQGQLWSTLDTGINGSGMTVGSFYPTVWIGSERRGFLWWADNDRGWIQDSAVPAHEAVRRDDAVVLINHIVAGPAELSVRRTLSLSYVATPFKPMVKGWRMSQSTEDGTFHQPFRNLRTDSKTGRKVFQNPGGGLLHVNWIHPESRYPEEWESLWLQQRTEGFAGWPAADSTAHHRQWRDPYAARAFGFTHMSFQIFGYGRKTLEDHLYDYFGAEWEPDTWNDTYTDYAMYLFDAAFNRGGVRSTYWDLTFPILFNDPLSGLAYRLPDGRVQNGYNGWNLRRFNMRLYAMQADAGLFPGANGFHSTNAYVPVAMPWVDAVLDGERNWDLESTPLDWVDNMPIDRMRSMSIPHSWGVAICWMANMDTEDPDARDRAKRVQAQWVWMHDSWRNPYIPQLPVMPEPVLDWGVNDEASVYHPYWRNPFVATADDDVLISLWQLPDRAMLGVFNYSKSEVKDLSVAVDLAGLGLEADQLFGRLLWAEEGSDVAIEVEKDMLHVRGLPGHRLALIGLAAPADDERARAASALPAQLSGALPSSLTDFGLVGPATQHFAPDHAPAVRSRNGAIKVAMWKMPDRVLLAVENTDRAQEHDAVIEVDLDALGLTPRLSWQEFVGVRDLWRSDNQAPPATLDYHARSLAVEDIAPRAVRLIGIRRY